MAQGIICVAQNIVSVAQSIVSAALSIVSVAQGTMCVAQSTICVAHSIVSAWLWHRALFFWHLGGRRVHFDTMGDHWGDPGVPGDTLQAQISICVVLDIISDLMFSRRFFPP